MLNDLSSSRGSLSLKTILERIVAEESELAAMAQTCVWRVRGSPLQSLKRLFTEQGKQIERWMGELAQQASAIGVSARRQPEPTGSLVEETDPPARALMVELLTRHEQLAEDLRQAVESACRRELEQNAARTLQRLLEFHETSAWMLRLLLDSPEPARVR